MWSSCRRTLEAREGFWPMRPFSLARGAWRLLLLCAIVLGGSGPPAAKACGPSFPNSILLGQDGDIYSAPGGDFRAELTRLLPSRRVQARTDRHPCWSLEGLMAGTEERELAEALGPLGMPYEQQTALLAEHESLRSALAKMAAPTDSWKRKPGDVPGGDLRVPQGLPAEFEDYIRGAILYHRGEMEEARAEWQRLLSRPASERRFRSTWAAFMMGKTWIEKAPEKALEWFRRTRELAAEGFADSLSLATSSYGWEAFVALGKKEYIRAIHLYLEQFRANDGGGLTSLRTVARRILEEGGVALEAAAKDAEARCIVTAHMLCQMSFTLPSESPLKQKVEAWLAAVDAAGIKDVEGADRLAWLAYKAGRIDLARRWLARAPDGSPIASWIRAKLALRAGRIDEAARILSTLVHLFPEGQSWGSLPVDGDGVCGRRTPAERIQGEIAVLEMGRRNYREALDALLRADYWFDAAYVAERVLTAEELKDYVDSTWSEEASKEPRKNRFWISFPTTDHQKRTEIRSLLGRRLARLQRFDDALPYLPASLHEHLALYVRSLEEGKDGSRQADARAESLWRAARIARHLGMELFGTELDPDWQSVGGSYELRAFGDSRSGDDIPERFRADEDEKSRASAHKATPQKRFHYRYLAADLAMTAAMLLPQNSDRAARYLAVGGSWLAKRDPRAADAFYKTLVRRCRKTALGEEADKIRWFPDLSGDDGAYPGAEEGQAKEGPVAGADPPTEDEKEAAE